MPRATHVVSRSRTYATTDRVHEGQTGRTSNDTSPIGTELARPTTPARNALRASNDEWPMAPTAYTVAHATEAAAAAESMEPPRALRGEPETCGAAPWAGLEHRCPCHAREVDRARATTRQGPSHGHGRLDEAEPASCHLPACVRGRARLGPPSSSALLRTR